MFQYFRLRFWAAFRKTYQSVSVAASSENASQKGLSHIDRLENQAYDGRLALAEIEVKAAELGINQELFQEFMSFINAQIEGSVNSVMEGSWQINSVLLKQSKQQKLAHISMSTLAEFSRYMGFDKTKWDDAASVEGDLTKINGFFSKKEAEGMPLSLAQQQELIAGTAVVMAGQLSRDPALSEQTLGHLEAFVQKRIGDPLFLQDALPASYALGIMGRLSDPAVAAGEGKGLAALEERQKKVDDLIYQICHLFAGKIMSGEISADAADGKVQAILGCVEQYRPVTVQIGRIIAKIVSTAPSGTAVAGPTPLKPASEGGKS